MSKKKQYAADTEGTGLYFYHEVEQKLPKLYERKYPDLKSRLIVPTLPIEGLPAEIRSDLMDMHAEAEIVSDNTTVLPAADFSVGSTTLKVQLVAQGVNWSIQEERMASSSDAHPQVKRLVDQRVSVAAKAIERKYDKILADGEAANGMAGFIDNAAVNEANVALDASATSRLWADKTADEIVEDISEPIRLITSQTKSTHSANTIVLPDVALEYLTLRKMSTNSDETIFSYVLNKLRLRRPDFQIIPWWRLDGAGASGTDRMIVFERDPDVVSAYVAVEMETLAPRRISAFKWQAAMFMAATGVLVRYPKAIEYRDGFFA